MLYMSPAIHAELLSLLRGMSQAEASDLHLVTGNRPMYRIHGHLSSAAQEVLAPGRAIDMIKTLVDPSIAGRLNTSTDLDFAVQVVDGAKVHRYRINVFSARGERGACVRSIPDHIPTLPELGFTAELGERIVTLNNGLVLVTGVTGSGKTTSIAALLQLLNARGNCRIITIEEPIEYIFPPCGDSIVTQREVGSDVPSFSEGLRSGLRQDPDVLVVGEIRDRETAQLAMSAAETGHLIFGTLHSADAKGAITRMVDLFPAEMHDDIRTQLSMSLRYIVAQHLLPTNGGGRRVLATEVMFANFSVRSAIRQGKLESLDSAIQSGRKDGMWTLDADLRRLVTDKKTSLETARTFAKDPAEFGC